MHLGQGCGGGGAPPDASAVTYTPAVVADWTGSADPGNTDDALDQLALRLTNAEIAAVAPFTQHVWFNAGATIPIGALVQQFGVHPNQQGTYQFSATANNAMQWDWQVPTDWVSGAVTVVVHYAKLALGAGNIVHSVNYCALAIGVSIGAAGTDSNQTVAVAADPALLYEVITWAALFTPGAVGEIWRFNYTRVGSDVADTYAGGSGVFGVEMLYTAIPNP